MKKAFTLIELIAILTILGILATILTPIVLRSIKNSREQAYLNQVSNIVSVAKKWGLANVDSLPNVDNSLVCVTVEDLKLEGLLANEEIKNPKDETVMDGSIDIIYDDEFKNYEYEYKDTPCATSNYLIRKASVGADQITVVLNDEEGTNYRFKMAASCELINSSEWIDNSTQRYYTFNNLNTNSSYCIKGEITKNATTYETANITLSTNELEPPTITSQDSEITFEAKTVYIDIKEKLEDYTYRYKINTGSWITITDIETSLEVIEDETNIIVEVLKNGVSVITLNYLVTV